MADLQRKFLSSETTGPSMLYRGMRILGLLVFALIAMPSGVFAQTQQKGPIKVIVPFPPGELADALARLLSEDMSKDLGQSIVVENRPGASGLIGIQAVANAAPDGQTLLVGQLGTTVVAPLVNNWSLDLRKALEPVALTYTNYVMIVAAPEFKAKSLKELIEYSKANPGSVNIGTVGLGSFNHLLFELLRKQTGFEYNHVPYKGSSQIATDLMTGRIDVSTLGFATGWELSKDGRVRALAMTGRARNPLAPDVPSASETVPGFEFLGWFGFFAPKGTPSATIDRINAAINRAMTNPAIQERVKSHHVDSAAGSPADFARLWNADYERFSSLIREIGVAPN